MTLTKVISGGQSGSDQAGLAAAKFHNIPTGGLAPYKYMTTEGENPGLKHLYGLKESSGSYKDRTWSNVFASDATIRLAVDFNSPGEKCTMNAIVDYGRPFFDIPLEYAIGYVDQVIYWIGAKEIETLNVAGNSQGKLGYDIYSLSYAFLFYVFAHFAP